MRAMFGVAAAILAAAFPAVALAQPPTITGTNGADTLRGTASADRIEGKAGADRINGRAGRDVIRCGSGRDYVIAQRQDVVADDCETVTYRRSLTDQIVDSPLEHHDQHGEPGGHLPGSSESVELVGQLDIEGAAAGRVADVSAYGNYAYLTVRDPEGCSDAGVAIMDISDPTDPVQVGFIDATEG
jgi:Ca2+-binding RTX toxin-like protein